MTVNSVNIVATGARTPLGLHSRSSAAAMRAGINGMAEHPFMIDHMGDPMPGALDYLIDPALIGVDRFLALAETALQEVCAPLAASQNSLQKLPLFLGLPELRPGFTEQDAQMIQSRLLQCIELPVEISSVHVSTEGHASGLLGLGAATEKIQKGELDACIIGGVESYFHPDTMEWLDENRQLATADARSAFVPGEGAGFCLLMNDQTCRRLQLSAQTQILNVGVGRETKLIKTSDVCLGEGLTESIKQAVTCLPPETKINNIICDINGERYRGEEWGFVCTRLAQYFDDPTGYISPTGNWGDMGSASGPLFVMLACQAAMKGYAKGPLSMLWASSEGGLRVAVVLESRTGDIHV